MICSKPFTLIFALSLILILTSTLVFAAHPLITDDAGTQGKGKFQVELNGAYGQEKEDGVKEQAFEISSILTYGLLDNLDIVLGVPYQSIKTKEEGEEGWERNRESGFSDVSFEVKWRFYEIEGFSFALKPGVTFPVGNEKRGLGPGRVTYSLHSIVSKEIGPLAFHANLGYIRNENKVDERKDLWHVSLATEVEAVKNLKLVGNIGIERNPDKDSHRNPAFLLGGLIYSVTERLDVDFGVKYGLNKPETDYTLLIGITFKF